MAQTDDLLTLPTFDKPVKVLIVCAPYYRSIANALVTGAQATLEDAGATHEVVEVPGALGRHRPLVRAEREGVGLLAGDPVERGDLLGRLAHGEGHRALAGRRGPVGRGEPRVGEPPPQRGVEDLAGLGPGRARLRHHPRRPGHRLDAARHHHPGLAGADGLRGRGDGERTAPRGEAGAEFLELGQAETGVGGGAEDLLDEDRAAGAAAP